MAINRINGRKARPYVEARKDFMNSNGQFFGYARENGDYVVYSYGTHWPLLLYRQGQWFGNNERYSRTTSRHLSNAMPYGQAIQWMDKDQLQSLIRNDQNV